MEKPMRQLLKERKIMNKEEIENKITGIITDSIYSRYDSQEQADSAISACVKELSTLIQESNREAVEKFRSFCEGEVYEKRLSDEHYVLVSILIDTYLSSIGKDK